MIPLENTDTDARSWSENDSFDEGMSEVFLHEKRFPEQEKSLESEQFEESEDIQEHNEKGGESLNNVGDIGTEQPQITDENDNLSENPAPIIADVVLECKTDEPLTEKINVKEIKQSSSKAAGLKVAAALEIAATAPKNIDAGERRLSRRLSFSSTTDTYEIPNVTRRLSLSSFTGEFAIPKNLTYRTFAKTHQMPRSLSLLPFIFLTGLASALLCLLAFIAIPHSNAFDDHIAGRNRWWQCVAAWSGCIGLFQAFTIRHTLEIFVVENSKNIGLLGTFSLWVSFAFGFFFGYGGFQYIWIYPAPYGIFVGYAIGIIALIPTIYFISRSKLRQERSTSSNAKRRRKAAHNQMVKQLLWLLASIAALIFILGMTITIAAVIDRTTGGVKFLGVPALAVWRFVSGASLSQLYLRIDRNAEVLGYFNCWLITGISTLTIIGNAEDQLFGVFLFLVDMTENRRAISIISMVTNTQRDGQVHSQILDRGNKQSIRWLVVSQLGGIIVPIFYLLCWIMIHNSANKDAFAGNGVSALGSSEPDSMKTFAANISLYFGLELTSVIVIHCYIWKRLKVNLLEHGDHILKRYGMYMALMSVLIMNFAFCLFMTSCGVDLSFSFDW